MPRLFRMVRSTGALILPGGLIFFLTVSLVRSGIAFFWLSGMGQALLYMVPVIGLFFGWRFHRSRLAAVTVLIALFERVLFYFGSGSSGLTDATLSIQTLIGALLPLNLYLLLFGREYRLQRLPSLIVFGLIFLQLPAAVWLIRNWPQLADLLTQDLVDVRIPFFMAVPQPFHIMQGAVLLFFLVRALLKRKPVVCGFFWLLLTTFYGLYCVETASARMFCFFAAGVIVILTLVESVYSMAFRDELTDLPGRRALNSAFLGLTGGYAVAMLDIDFFKKFNDRYGHDVGDQVLRMVAALLSRVEGGGQAFRYGGEEFTILFAGKTKKEVLPHLEKLRQSVAEASFMLRGKNRPRRKPKKKKTGKRQARTVSVTISIGVADETAGGNAADIVKAADQALYSAKKKGRNRVE